MDIHQIPYNIVTTILAFSIIVTTVTMFIQLAFKFTVSLLCVAIAYETLRS